MPGKRLPAAALVQRLECPCVPGKIFARAASLRKHQTSQRHRAWALSVENRRLRVDLVAADNRCRELETIVQQLIAQPRRRRVTERVKKQVAADQQWKCSTCDCLLSSAYQVDHIIPLWKAGSNERDNLTALCPNCHALKTQLEAAT
jgi:5-methylcytosine-specific restriction endonuclease McrA